MSTIEGYIEQQRDRFLDELAALCAIPSVAVEGRGMDEAADWVATRLSDLGATVERVEAPGATPTLFAEIGPVEAERTLLIYNHYDVQPPEPPDLWDSSPFAPEMRRGRFYARGVADNKGDLLSRVHAIEAWQAVRGTLPVRVRWVIEGEEEIGSPGLPAVCDAHGARWADSDGCLWEAGYKDEHERMVLYSGLKGIATFELRARGAQADGHSSLATLLPNALWRLVWALATLKGPDETILVNGLTEHVAPPTEAERRLLEQIPFDGDGMRAAHGVPEFVTGAQGLAALMRHLYEPTCTVNGVHGGYTGPGMKTVLPARAVAKLEFRLVPDLTPELVTDLLRQHLERHGFADIEVVPLAGEHAAPGRVESDVVHAALDAYGVVSDVAPVLWPHVGGNGPMYPVAARFGIPSVGFGVGYYGSNPHAPNEHIRLDDYFETVAVMATFLGAFADRRPEARAAGLAPHR